MRSLIALIALLAVSSAWAAGKTMAQVLEATRPTDWRRLDPENTLYVELQGGQLIVMELAPRFAPKHVENIRAMVRAKYFDGMAINRVQDNFVVQWGDPEKPLGQARRTLPAEFTRQAEGLPFVALPDPDPYAPQVGFAEGFPAARDSKTNTAWPVHCYGTVGAGRDEAADSGGGTELYIVIGHAPRQLDRNITVVGRVVMGMEWLSALPRGPVPMGLYEQGKAPASIKTVRLAADLPEQRRLELEVLRTDVPAFADLVESRRNRREDWYKVPAGHIDVCNVPLPVRNR